MTKLQRYKSIGLFTLMLFLTTTSAIAQESVSDAALQHAKELLRSSPLIDGHNDLPWLIREENGGDVPAFRLEVENEFDTDIPRMRATEAVAAEYSNGER